MTNKSGLWKHPNFLRLWSAQAISAFGSRVSRTAMPVVAIVAIQASPFEVAALSAIQLVPAIFVGALVGGFIERAQKKRLLIFADLARAALLLTVPLAAFLDALTMAQLYSVTFLIGACSSVFRISDNAYLPSLIDKADLVDGNSKLEGTESLAEIGGPSLAGVLIGIVGAPLSLLADAVTFLFSAIVLARIDAKEDPAAAQEEPASMREDLLIGIRAGFGNKQLAPTFYVLCVQSFFFGFFVAMYMVFTIEVLEIDIAKLGFIIGLGGVGALVGAFLAKPLLRAMGLGPMLLLTAFVGQGAYVFIPLAEIYPAYQLSLLCAQQVLGDAFLVAFIIIAVSYRQALLPIDVMARASGALDSLGSVLLVSGAIIAGVVATSFSVSAAIWVAAAGGLLAMIPLLSPTLLRVREMPAS